MTDSTVGARRLVSTLLPTRHGTFVMHGYDGAGGLGHVALSMGNLDTPLDDLAPLVRVHSECLTGDALGSRRCDCGEQLDAALAEIATEGRGVLVYVRGHEGRGIGLLAKLEAYALQDVGVDTVDANIQLGYPADARDYAAAADILRDLGVTRVRLMSHNPDKAAKLEALGIEVAARQPLTVPDRPENAFYLATKRARMGHDSLAPAPDVWTELLSGRVPAKASAGEDQILLDRYAPLVEAGDITIAQLAQSLDGFIAARSGDAEFVSGEEDRTHLHRLRALVDAVVIGVGSIVADDARLTVRAVPGANPTRIVLDPSARAPRDSRVLTDGAAPTLWVVGEQAAPGEAAAHVSVLRLPLVDGVFQPATVLAALHARGLRRVLVEGGGKVVSSFLQAGLLDRLFLTSAPVLIGDGVPGIRFTGSDRLAEALRAPVRRFVLGEDVCTEVDLSALRNRA